MLGDVPPKLYDVRVYGDEHDVVDDLFIDLGFDWRSNFDLELGVSAFPGLLAALPDVIERGAKHLTTIEVGAEDVCARGRLRISLRPLLSRLPVIGAVRVALWEMPDLHFEVTALGGQVALLPMLKTWLYDTIKSAVLTPYLAPGGLQVALAPVRAALVPQHTGKTITRMCLCPRCTAGWCRWRSSKRCMCQRWTYCSCRRRLSSAYEVLPPFKPVDHATVLPP